MQHDFKIFPLGIDAATIDFGNIISETANRRVLAVAEHLTADPFPGMIECIPAYSSLTVFYSPVGVAQTNPHPTTFHSVSEHLRTRAAIAVEDQDQTVRRVEVPVDFSADAGPDLAFIASSAGLGTDEAIDIFTEREYRVYMLGFLPGFAYMGEVDERIATPRKETPRTSVPAGSVGIAGRQTGVYPFDSPGGWQIIGRTDLRLFDADAEPPTYFRPGDLVCFVKI